MRITKRSFSTVVFPPRYSLRKRGSALGLSKTFEKIPTTKVRLIFEASKFRRSIHCTVYPIANALLIRQNARHDRKVAKNPKNYESQPNRPRTPRIVAHRAHSASESVGNPCPRMRNSQSNRQTNSRLRRSIPQILYYICKTAVIVRLFTLKPSLFHEKTVYPFHRPVRDAAGRLQRRVRRFGARETTGRFRAAARTTRTALQRHKHQSRFDADYCHGTRPRRLHHLRRTADGKRKHGRLHDPVRQGDAHRRLQRQTRHGARRLR